jgi:hypothetical protein
MTIPELLRKWALGEIKIPKDAIISFSYNDTEDEEKTPKNERLDFLFNIINNPLIDPKEIEEAERDLKEFQNRLNLNEEDLSKHPDAVTLALFKQWEEEDAKCTPEELEKDRQVYDEIEKNGIPRTSI